MKRFMRRPAAIIAIAAALVVGLSSCGQQPVGDVIGRHALIESLTSDDPKTVAATFATMANDLVASAGIKPLDWEYFQNLGELEQAAMQAAENPEQTPMFAPMLVTETATDAERSLPLAAMITGMWLPQFIQMRAAYEVGLEEHFWTLVQNACYGGVNVTRLIDRTGLQYTDADQAAIEASLIFLDDAQAIEEVLQAYEAGRSGNSLADCDATFGPS